MQEIFGAVAAADVARIDEAAAECGIGVVQLMELAGTQVAKLAWWMLGKKAGRIHVVCGRGNNGGDGLVAARHLAGWGCDVSALVLSDEAALGELQKKQCDAAMSCGVRVKFQPRDGFAIDNDVELIIDALLGTGAKGAPRPAHAQLIELLNASRRPVLSVDIPSGLDADTGQAYEPAVQAQVTCTLGAMKKGMWLAEAQELCGRIFVADIGIPEIVWRRCDIAAPGAVTGGDAVPVDRIRA